VKEDRERCMKKGCDKYAEITISSKPGGKTIALCEKHFREVCNGVGAGEARR